MKALLLTDYMHLELADVDIPTIGPRDVLIRVRSCGICGSDVHGIDGSTGRRVTFDSTISCGDCDFCRRGEVNLCDNRQVLGVSCGDYRRNGAFAEYVAIPQRVLYRLPPELPFVEAAMIEA